MPYIFDVYGTLLDVDAAAGDALCGSLSGLLS